MALDKLTIINNGGLSTTSDYRVGVLTATKFVGPIESDSATFNGSVSIGGTLTYEDVTNIDSVGIITARDGIDCNGDIDVDGHTNLDNVSIVGVTTFNDNTTFTGASSNAIWSKGNNSFELGDNTRLKIGNSADLSIYHSGSHSIIHDTGTGNLSIQSNAGEIQLSKGGSFEHMVRCIVDGTVELYYDGSKKFETTSTGVTVTGDLTATNDIIITGSGEFYGFDNSKIVLGHGRDLQIYHDGSHSYALNTTGNFVLGSNSSVDITDGDFTEYAARFIHDGSVELYHNNSKKFQTHPDGSEVLGHLLMTDNRIIKLGTSSDLQIFHDGNHSYIDNTGTGHLYIKDTGIVKVRTASFGVDNADGTEAMMLMSADGAVELYFDNTKRFETTGSGVKVSAGHLDLDDSQNIRLGNSQDFLIYHNGSNSIINDNGTGNLELVTNNGTKITLQGGSDTMANFIKDGAVELYYNNSKKLETVTGGVYVYGDIVGGVGGTGNISLGDNSKFIAGNGNDLQIYHSGSQSYIKHNGTGNLYIDIAANEYFSVTSEESETIIQSQSNGAVELYFNNSKKFETTANGVYITGAAVFPDGTSNGIQIGNSSDLQLYHDGSNSWIRDVGTGSLVISGSAVQIKSENGGEACLKAFQNGAVELYFDNSKKFETTANGVNIGNHIFTTGGNYTVGNNISVVDGGKIKVGTDDDLQIYHSGSWNYIQSYNSKNLAIQVKDTENAIIAIPDGEVQLYFDNSKKLATKTGGVEITNDNGVADLTVKGTGSNRADVRVLATGTGNANVYLDASNGDLSGADYAVIQHKNDLNLALVNYAKDIEMYVRSGTLGQGGLDKCFHAYADGAVELYHDNSKKFNTLSGGVQIYGNLAMDNNAKIQTGSSAHMVSIQGGATNMGGRIELRGGNGDGDIRFFAQGATSTAVQRLRIRSDGLVEFKGAGDSTEQISIKSGANPHGAQIFMCNFQGVNAGDPSSRLGVGKDDNALIFINAQPSANQVQNFAIGTSDATPLVLSTNNNQRFRIASGGQIGMGQDGSGNVNTRAVLEINAPYNDVSDNDGSADLSMNNHDAILINYSGASYSSGVNVGSIAWTNGGRRRAAIMAEYQSTDGDIVALSFFTRGTDGPNDFYKSFIINHNGSAGLHGALSQSTSDDRLKKDKVEITNALDKVNTLSSFTHKWNDIAVRAGLEEDKEEIGLSAQEVQGLYPCLVDVNNVMKDPEDPDTDYLTVHYEKVVPLLVASIKELTAKNKALEARLDALEGS